MAKCSMTKYLTTVTLLIINFMVLSGEPSCPVVLSRIDEVPRCRSEISLYGDAMAVNGGSSVQLTTSDRSSAGRLMNNKPIKVVEGKPPTFPSFSTLFSFALSNKSGDGLAFFMVPKGYRFTHVGKKSFGLSTMGFNRSNCRVVVVEFDTSLEPEYGDLNGNHVGIDVDSLLSVQCSNISSLNISLNSGKKLDSWIDYDASAKRLEVRLSHSGNITPVNPLLSYSIDLSTIWHDTDVFVGLTSSNGNTTQTCSVYAWTFKSWVWPPWMHSQPLDPNTFATDKNNPQVLYPKQTDSMWLGLAALLVGTVCVAILIYTIGLYLWSTYKEMRNVVQQEGFVHTVVCLDHK